MSTQPTNLNRVPAGVKTGGQFSTGARSEPDLTLDETFTPPEHVPGESHYITIERQYDKPLVVGPYPSETVAGHALDNALLIDGFCEEDALDAYTTSDQPSDQDEWVIPDLEDPDHTGYEDGVPDAEPTAEPLAPATARFEDLADSDKGLAQYITMQRPDVDAQSVARKVCDGFGIEVGAGDNPLTSLRMEIGNTVSEARVVNALKNQAQSDRHTVPNDGGPRLSQSHRELVDKESLEHAVYLVAYEFDTNKVKKAPVAMRRDAASGLTEVGFALPGDHMKVRVFDQTQSGEDSEGAQGELFVSSPVNDDPLVELTARQRKNRLNKVLDAIGPDRETSEKYLRRVLAVSRSSHDRYTSRF